MTLRNVGAYKMGIYLQGLDNLNKALQLIDKHGAVKCTLPSWTAIPEDKILICVVENGPFDAALVVADTDEYMYVFEAIKDYEDTRRRTFLLMDKNKAREMAWPKNF